MRPSAESDGQSKQADSPKVEQEARSDNEHANNGASNRGTVKAKTLILIELNGFQLREGGLDLLGGVLAVTFSEFTPGVGFQVELELGGFFAASESMGGVDSPRGKFRGIRDLGPIVFGQASLTIIGQSDIPSRWMTKAYQNINILKLHGLPGRSSEEIRGVGALLLYAGTSFVAATSGLP